MFEKDKKEKDKKDKNEAIIQSYNVIDSKGIHTVKVNKGTGTVTVYKGLA